jgi:hypothetical protein
MRKERPKPPPMGVYRSKLKIVDGLISIFYVLVFVSCDIFLVLAWAFSPYTPAPAPSSPASYRLLINYPSRGLPASLQPTGETHSPSAHA